MHKKIELNKKREAKAKEDVEIVREVNKNLEYSVKALK